jgi:hypothetical protein
MLPIAPTTMRLLLTTSWAQDMVEPPAVPSRVGVPPPTGTDQMALRTR